MYVPKLAFIYVRRPTNHCFSVVSKIGVAKSRLAIMRVTKTLANSDVRAGIGITTTVGEFSTGPIRTCKGLPSSSQKILRFLHSAKLIEVHLQLRLTLSSGVFVCDCEIDISKWCIQMVGSARSQCRTPGIKLFVAISRLKFSVLTFIVIWGSVLEHSFNKRVMSRIGCANKGCYLIVVCWLSFYHENFRSSDYC